jgi:hypothetical protein
MDEARHVEVFGCHLDEKMATRLDERTGVDDTLADSR